MEGRLTPTLGLTKPDTPRGVYERTINVDLDLIDAAIGDILAGGGGGGMANPMTTLGDIIRAAAAGVPVRLGIGAEATVLTVVGGLPAWAPSSAAPATEVGALEFTLGDGVATITTAEPVQWVEVPFDCTITGATLTADAVGSVVVDVQVADYATYPPDSADTVCGAAKPTLTAAIKSADVTLTGWDTSLTRGHYVRVVVVSAATVKRVVLSLSVEGT